MTLRLEDVASVAARAGSKVVRQMRSSLLPSAGAPGHGGQSRSGWLVVTVACDPSAVDLDRLPAPLADFGGRVEVRVGPAPSDKGSELGARFIDRPSAHSASSLSGDDPQAELRSMLRRAKQLIEVGQVLVLDPTPHGKRTNSPGGALLESWTQAAPKAGVR